MSTLIITEKRKKPCYRGTWRWYDYDNARVMVHTVYVNKENEEVWETEQEAFLVFDNIDLAKKYLFEQEIELINGKKKKWQCFKLSHISNSFTIKFPGVVIEQYDSNNTNPPPLIVVDQPDKDKGDKSIYIVEGEDYIRKDLLFIPYHQFLKAKSIYYCLNNTGKRSTVVMDKTAWFVPSMHYVYFNYFHLHIIKPAHPAIPDHKLIAGWMLEVQIYNVRKESKRRKKNFVNITYKPVFNVPFKEKHKRQMVDAMVKAIRKLKGGE